MQSVYANLKFLLKKKTKKVVSGGIFYVINFDTLFIIIFLTF